MSNQKIQMKPLVVIVSICIISALLLNIYMLLNNSLPSAVADDLLFFTTIYVSALLVMMGVHKSNLIKDEKPSVTDGSFSKLVKIYLNTTFEARYLSAITTRTHTRCLLQHIWESRHKKDKKEEDQH